MLLMKTFIVITKHIRPSDLSLLLSNILSDLSPLASQRKGPAWFTQKISGQNLWTSKFLIKYLETRWRSFIEVNHNQTSCRM